MNPLGPHRRSVAWCADCAKLCHFACPVSEATGNEVHTPAAKMAAVFQHQSGGRRFDEHAGAATYACTGCRRCLTWCRHENDVAQALFDARAVVVEEGEAPQPVDRVKEAFAAAGNPHGEDLGAIARRLAPDTEGRPFFPGCTALARTPDTVTGAIDAAAGFGLRLALPEVAGSCCGYPLWAAGFRTEFKAHAQEFARKLERTPELIIGDPGCAWTLLHAYRAVGVELQPRILLLVDLLAERVEYAFGRAPMSMKVAYHDSCMLGRGLGRYDGPRRLLRAAVGEFYDPPESREDGGCSGGGGLLPLTQPEVSMRIAAERAAELGAPQRRIVTACPTACRSFRKAGADAIDLFSLLARWIEARGEGE